MHGRHAQTTAVGNISLHAAAALAGGLFAVMGALVVHVIMPLDSSLGWANTVLFGPVTEELLKASGALFLLEKMPWRLPLRGAGVGLILVVMTSALIFAVVENLLYVHLYVQPSTFQDPMGYVVFRWTVPTVIHLTCSGIAGLGLAHMWRQQTQRGTLSDLDLAFPHFATAMGIHGLYNLGVTLLDDRLFPKAT
jgi:RsiW-degrading membrane proteinase PrsW (M82 family)